MKRHLIAALMFGLALMAANGASAGPFEDGLAAAQRQDFATALRLWKPLADKGDADAQSNLGAMYDTGTGVAQDYKEAVRLYRLAAAQGKAFTHKSAAQYNLGLMYYKGTGEAQDYKEAVKWWRLAAAQGNADAQYNLGVMYDEGQGVAQDYKEVVKWWRLAAAQGNAAAQYNLGWLYDEGQGVTQDFVRAHMWYNLGAISGENKNASSNRDNIAKMKTPSQIEKAQDMARKCQASNFKQCD